MLHVIGLGVTETAQLSQEASRALQSSEWVIGSERQLATVEITANQQAIVLPKLAELKQLLIENHDKTIALLASGDPLYFGIGRWLKQNFVEQKLCFYPAISSIQAACHSIGLSLQDAKVISLHGRPLYSLKRHLSQHRYLVILTDQYSHPKALAQICMETGFTDSRLWVCEKLGYDEQQVCCFEVSELIAQDISFDPLHVSILEVQGQSSYLPNSLGVPDQDFITDAENGKGMLTKREVRLAILGLLQPSYQDIAWDIGAGCGGVAVEWALAQQQAKVYAIEHNAERLACLAQNQQRFGVIDNLNIVSGRAPEALNDLPAANKVFIGGSDGELAELLKLCWEQLPKQGVLVGSTVTETSKQIYLQFADTLKDNQVETLQIATSKGGKLAGQWIYRPSLPVTLFKFIKD